MEWSIRSARPTDCDALHALVLESAPIGAQAWSLDGVASALEARGARVLLAETGSNPPAGFVVARRIGDGLEIDLVGVRAAARRRGVARSLLEALIEAEVAKGLSEARLELAATNAAARALYAGLGFMVVGTRTRYYPDGADALLLSRLISPPGRPSPS